MELVKRAYRYMEIPIKKYLLFKAVPLIASGIIFTIVVITIFPSILDIPYVDISILTLPLWCIAIAVLYPVLIFEVKRNEIDENILFFITQLNILSTAKIPVKKIILIIAEKKEYGAISDEIRKIFVLMDNWNMNLSDAARSISKRTPSVRLSEFLDRMAQAIDAGENFSDFLEKEQLLFMTNYDVAYKNGLEKIEIMKEVFVSIVVSTMFMLVFITLIPMVMSSNTSLLLVITLVVFFSIELLIVYSVRDSLPSDKIWHAMTIRPWIDRFMRWFLPFIILVCISIALILNTFFEIQEPRVIIAISIVPLLLPGIIIKREEEKLKKCDEMFDSFIRAIGVSSESFGGNTEIALKKLKNHNFGGLTAHIDVLYKRLKTRIDKARAWMFFSAGVGSNLISKFTDMYIKGTMLGGNTRKMTKIISENFVKILNLRKQRYQTEANVVGMLYGLAVAITFTLYVSLNIMNMMNNVFTEVEIPQQVYVPLIFTNYNLFFMEFFVITIISIHAFCSALLINTISGGHRYGIFIHLTSMIWVSVLISIVADTALTNLML